MTTQTLNLMLPVQLQPSDSVKVWLFRTPSEPLHVALVDLGFYASGYSDERNGRVGSLGAIIQIAEGQGNPVYKMQTIGDQDSTVIIGAIDAHARVYAPEHRGARHRGGVLIHPATRVERLSDQWVAWGSGAIEVTL